MFLACLHFPTIFARPWVTVHPHSHKSYIYCAIHYGQDTCGEPDCLWPSCACVLQQESLWLGTVSSYTVRPIWHLLWLCAIGFIQCKSCGNVTQYNEITLKIICFFPCLNNDTSTRRYDLYCLHEARELSESELTRIKVLRCVSH